METGVIAERYQPRVRSVQFPTRRLKRKLSMAD
jgi:hypothetical protein